MGRYRVDTAIVRLVAGLLAVRGWTRVCTESGEAPGWQGATRGE